MKQKIFDKLVKNLEDLTKQYRMLLDCVRKEKEFLIQSNLEKLNENNVLKEQLLMRIRSLDGLRVNYAAELAQIVGADAVQPRLLDISKRIGGGEGDRLRSIHSTLEIVTTRLVQINKDNATYAESGIQTIGNAMENLKETLMGQKTYKKKGGYQQGPDKSGHFVSKEA
ncbi:MAG: hypothetical protein A2622_03385 [Bdellovibrionales bacterium RIFCSPHIGHO2_01_FULL_40_29]|nr:MAG: hypothetical protein A2622_03385 [Bdellovibrionales bacterium RIFCSPHIGHO2_01_FULL_40_29]OFZ34111.1 MAG: hypothetical protein A3D17_03805 [Bdellovibrionales bacterium RIFCSPHIGHO2_02_FULL_40_15]